MTDYTIDLKDLRDKGSPIVDMVNSPPHYTQGEIEAIDVIRQQLGSDGFINYCEGNALKYLMRWRHKGGTEDLRKLRWYVDRMIEVACG